MAKDVPHMIRGLSMGSRFLALLVDEIEKKGGRGEMLHFLTTERGRESIGKVAEFIVSLPWEAPLSLIMELSRAVSFGMDYEEQEEDYTCFYWEGVMDTLRIPYICLGGDYARRCGYCPERPLPVELLEQLHGQPAEPGMQVTLEGQQYVVTLLYAGNHTVPKRGERIERDEVFLVHLAPSFFFDLDN